MSEAGAPPPLVVGAEEYARRLRALLGKGGITNGFPRRARDRWILLHAVAEYFGSEEHLSEIEATGRIGGFLLEWAPRWRIDRVSIRRELVDGGFLDRDSDGRDYRRSRRHEARIAFEAVPRASEAMGGAATVRTVEP